MMNSYKKLKKITKKSIKTQDNDVLLLCKVLKTIFDNDVVPYNDLIRLKQHREAFGKLTMPINKLSVPQRRRIIVQQGKGFLPILLPIAISALWSILSQK